MTKQKASRSRTDRDIDGAFAEIVRIVQETSYEADTEQYQQYQQYPGAGDETGGEVGIGEIGCSVKTLPPRLALDAAKVAARVNPANAPLLEATLAGVIEPSRATVLTSRFWGPAPRQFTVSFLDSPPADLRRRILEHLNAWSRSANKTFVETSGTGEIRISRGPGGFASHLGTDVLLVPPHRPTMNLQGFTMSKSESEFRRVIRHEAGHTLGFVHEHLRRELVDRIDPQKAYAFYRRTQNWDRAEVDHNVLTPLDERDILGTPSDQESIMCYPIPGSITRDGQPILGGADINPTDFEFAGLIYPKVFPGPNFSPARHEDDWDPAEDVVLPV